MLVHSVVPQGPLMNITAGGTKFSIEVPTEDQIRMVCTRLGLTKRETDIVYQTLLGKKRADIADALCITVATVESYWKNICPKIGVRTRNAVRARIWDVLYGAK